MYNAVDRKSKLYHRKEDVRTAHRPSPGMFLPPLTENGFVPRIAGKAPGESKIKPREIIEQVLLQQYAPAGALINARGDILFLHGRTGRYLEPAPGEADMNILKMARAGLRRDLTLALRQAGTRQEPVRRPGLRVKTNDEFVTVNLTVRPVARRPEPGRSAAGAAAAPEPNLFLVILEEAPADQKRPEKAAGDAGEDAGESATVVDARIEALEQELRAKDEYIQSTNEELETSNEELTSSNEEMQSINEELQSANEELETAKEELQSVNEELNTVNAELQAKLADLTQVNNDMHNMITSTGIGTIFVDNQLHIQSFTPAVTRVINLIQSDLGRPLAHIATNLAVYGHLVADVQSVMHSLMTKEVEVQTTAGEWFLLRIRPYRTLENAIEGAVITFTEITDIKKAQSALKESETVRRLAVVVCDARDAIMVQDMEGRILAWNPAAERMYGWTEAEALAMNIGDLIPKDRRKEALAIVKKLARAEILEPYRAQRVAKDGRIIEVWLTVTALVNGSGKVYGIATTERLKTPVEVSPGEHRHD